MAGRGYLFSYQCLIFLIFVDCYSISSNSDAVSGRLHPHSGAQLHADSTRQDRRALKDMNLSDVRDGVRD